VERLRPDSNFDSVDALIAQMQQDERQARSILLAIA
jgi:FAD synthase